MQTIYLGEDCKQILHLCKRDKRLAKVIKMVGPITYSVSNKDPYVFLLHEIIEQMLSIKAGTKIFGRLEDLCEGAITPDKVNKLTDEQIKCIGTSNSKVLSIRNLTNKIISGELNLYELNKSSDEIITKSLLSLRGIGNWTVKMYLLFILDRQDILPYEDAAFLQSYCWMYKTNDKAKESIIKKCQKWKPYSSIAARYLYRALDMGLTKEEFHLFK